MNVAIQPDHLPETPNKWSAMKSLHHMVFTEQKTKKGYKYKVEDVFGVITIESDAKLNGDTLDGMVVLLLRTDGKASISTGKVETKTGIVTYRFEKRATWEPGNEDEDFKVFKPCESTPTSTKKQESEDTATNRSRVNIWSWCKRFVVAFQEAWKKTKN